MLIKKTISLFVLLFSNMSLADYSSSDVGILIRDEFALGTKEFCSSYSAPVFRNHGQWQIRDLFQVDSKKALKRIELAPKQYDQLMATHRVETPSLQKKSKQLLDWLNLQIISGHLKTGGSVVEKINDLGIVSQLQHCHKKHKYYDQVIERIQQGDEPNKDAKIRHFKSLKQKVIETECLRMTMAMADAGQRRIVIGDTMLARYDILSLKFALLHELCHIEFPGIYGMSNEEVFCDAMAWRWGVEILKKHELEQLAGTAKKPGLVTKLLLPPNPNMELLVMRSQLPMLCRDSLFNH